MAFSYGSINYTLPQSKPANAKTNIAGTIYDGANKFWELEEGDDPSKLVNTIEVIWNNAEVKEDENIKNLNITSELLDWIQNMVSGKRFLNLLIEFIKSNSLEVIPTKDKLYLEIRKSYYWYIGDTIPTSLPTNDSNLATGTNPGWRKIGNSKPNVGTILFDGKTSINISSTKKPYYFACNSDINILVYDSFGNICETFINGPLQNNGMNVYTTTFDGKSFNNVLKISN